MKKSVVILTVCILILSVQLNAQNKKSAIFKNDKSSLGIGIGLDHGGIGGNLTLYPTKNIGVFGGFGYAFAGVGYNAGVKLRFVSDNPKSGYVPYIVGMYGYNTVIHVKNASSLDKFFYGPSVGIGLDIRPGNPDKKSYWSLSLLYPVRSSDVEDYREDLENHHSVVFDSELIPLAFTISYRLVIKYFDN
ncbi:MAG: hypothetical protein JXR31_17120 [Prolixibacteraceae bacterium]|nr:hypothetical protein [Prolixibacteraceae bacterium]MBN2775980.1 hypothetical protein [Prolixibacteraceae bacterium]